MLRLRDACIYFLFIILLSCGTNQTADPNIDTSIKGTINISADESFKPVIFIGQEE